MWFYEPMRLGCPVVSKDTKVYRLALCISLQSLYSIDLSPSYTALDSGLGMNLVGSYVNLMPSVTF